MQQEDTFGAQNIGYEQLQRQFQQVLRELANDQNLQRFRVQYEKIHSALKRSHQQQRSLLTRCRELSKDILGGAGKVQIALKMSNDDMQTITYLRAQLNKTYKYLQMSKQHQETSKLKINELNANCKKLTTELQTNQSMNQGQVASVQECMSAIDQLKKQNEVLDLSINSNNQDFEQVIKKIGILTHQIQKLKVQLQKLNSQRKDQENKVKSQQEEKKKKKNQLNNIKKDLDTINIQKTSAKQIFQNNSKIVKQRAQQQNYLISQQDKQKKTKMMYQKQQQDQLNKKKSITNQVEHMNSILNEKIYQKNALNDQLQKIKSQNQKLGQQKRSIQDQKMALKEKKKQSQQVGQRIKLAINQLQNQLQLQKKNAGRDQSFIQKIRRDRDVIQKQLQQAELNCKRLKQQYNAKLKLKAEKKNFCTAQKAQKQRLDEKIIILNVQSNKYMKQARQADAKHYFARDQVKQRDNFIKEVKHINKQTEQKLKRQQKLYQSVRSNRNMVSKRLSQVQEEKTDFQKKFRTVIYKISQLKQDIDSKENQYVKQHGQNKKKDKTIDELNKTINKHKQQIKKKNGNIQQLQNKINHLRSNIKDAQDQRQKIDDQYKMVVAQRDILGTQLIRRNAQASLLYQKIKISQSTLAKGQAQYNQRLNQIQNKQQQIKKLATQINQYKKDSGSIVSFKNQIHSLSKELIQERLKVKALSQQLESPMNVHRWRKLQATDNITFELMTKIQSLQRRLIQKNQQVHQKQNQVKQKDFELLKIQNTMKRLPAIQEQKMIVVYQDNLNQKSKQIQAMKQQLINSADRLSQYRLQQQRLKKVHTNLKKKYYDQKKRQQQARQDPVDKATQPIRIHLPQKRFTGGGFNLG